MRNPFKKNSAEWFFWKHAGYSYGSGESREAGRKRCAISLAQAEKRATEIGLSFHWEQDDITDEEFRDKPLTRSGRGNYHFYYLWQCLCRTIDGKVVGSLGGVDFGAPPADPWSDNYRRVCEAEIASEAIKEAEEVSA